MGNDNKIDRLSLEQGKSLFLPTEIEDVDGLEIKRYMLDEEYSKTRKNRSVKVYLVLLGFLALQGLFTYLTVLYIDYRDSQAEINVSEFASGDLKEVLSAQKSEEEKLKKAKKDLEDLKSELNARIENIKKTAGEEKKKVASGPLSDVEKKSTISKIDLQEKEDIRETKADYDIKVQKKEGEIAVLEENVRKARSEVEKGAIQADRMLSNAERVTRIKLEKQKIRYQGLMRRLVLKYNPKFRDSEVREILKEKPEEKPELKPFEYSSIMKKTAGLSEEHYTELIRLQGQHDLLMKEIQKIPYINSVGPAVDHLDSSHAVLMSEYNRIMERLIESNALYFPLLNSYDFAFEHLTRKSPETGYIVDSREQAKVTVYVNPVIRITPGLRAKIFRRDDEQIGEIEFLGDGTRRARVVSLVAGKEILPFDRVLIQFQSDTKALPGRSMNGGGL